MICELFHAFPWNTNCFILFHELWIDSVSCISMKYFHNLTWIMNQFVFMHFHDFSWIMNCFMLFHELWIGSFSCISMKRFHGFPWIWKVLAEQDINNFHGFPWVIFMVIHEFEKSQAEQEEEQQQQEQFSNFKDRGFALAVKKPETYRFCHLLKWMKQN